MDGPLGPGLSGLHSHSDIPLQKDAAAIL